MARHCVLPSIYILYFQQLVNKLNESSEINFQELIVRPSIDSTMEFTVNVSIAIALLIHVFLVPM